MKTIEVICTAHDEKSVKVRVKGCVRWIKYEVVTGDGGTLLIDGIRYEHCGCSVYQVK